MNKEFDGEWQGVAEEVMGEMKAWRVGHPQATMQEIEKALDVRMAKLRVQMLADMVMASETADLTDGEGKGEVACPECGGRVEARGKQERRLTSQQNQTIRIVRSYAVCPQCGAGFFPSG
jgi:YgiT-type zinc finger domain-containing protein